MVFLKSAKSCDTRQHSLRGRQVESNGPPRIAATGGRRFQHERIGNGERTATPDCFQGPFLREAFVGECSSEIFNPCTFHSRICSFSESQVKVPFSQSFQNLEEDIPQERGSVSVGESQFPNLPTDPRLPPASEQVGVVGTPVSSAQISATINRSRGPYHGLHTDSQGEAVSASGKEFAVEHSETWPTHGNTGELITEHGLGKSSGEAADCEQICSNRELQMAGSDSDQRGEKRKFLDDRRGSLSPKHLVDSSAATSRKAETAVSLHSYSQRSKTPRYEGQRLSGSSCAAASVPSSGSVSLTHTSLKDSGNKPASSAPINSHSQEELVRSVLPCQEASVRQLLPALPKKESVALRMKSTIESLYEDSLAAIQSSQSDFETHSPQESELKDDFASYYFVEKSKPARPFDSTSRTTTTASIWADDQGAPTATFVGNSLVGGCGESFNNPQDAEVVAAEIPDITSTLHVTTALASTDHDEWKSLGDNLPTEVLPTRQACNPDDVVFVVHEDWEVSTLLYCSRTGFVRAVASAVSRVTKLNRPPDLSRLPTRAKGGKGCRQCSTKLDSPCDGWWRSRYVLLRVSTTLVNRVAGTADMSRRPTCCSCGSRAASMNSQWGSGWRATDDDTPKESRSHEIISCSSRLQPSATPNDKIPESSGNFLGGGHGIFCMKRAVLERSTGTLKSAPAKRVIKQIACNSSVTAHSGGVSESFMATTSSLKPAAVAAAVLNPVRVDENTYFKMNVQQILLQTAEEAACTATGATNGYLAYTSNEGDKGSHVAGIPSHSSPIQETNVPLNLQESLQRSEALSVEPGGDSFGLTERYNRLMSLLASPCDSFDEFNSAAWTEESVWRQERRADSVPVPCGASFDFFSSSSPCGTVTVDTRDHDQFAVSVRQPKCVARRTSLAAKRRDRGLTACGSAQAPSANAQGRKTRLTLERCYSACARTIGPEALNEAENSFLGICNEERELAAVFLEFVRLVAPGFAKACSRSTMRGRPRRPAVVIYPADGMITTRLCPTVCIKAQARMLLPVLLALPSLLELCALFKVRPVCYAFCCRCPRSHIQQNDGFSYFSRVPNSVQNEGIQLEQK